MVVFQGIPLILFDCCLESWQWIMPFSSSSLLTKQQRFFSDCYVCAWCDLYNLFMLDQFPKWEVWDFVRKRSVQEVRICSICLVWWMNSVSCEDRFVQLLAYLQMIRNCKSPSRRRDHVLRWWNHIRWLSTHDLFLTNSFSLIFVCCLRPKYVWMY